MTGRDRSPEQEGKAVIHYHGLPITPETAASVALSAGHGFVSFAEPRNLSLAAEVCQSFAIDNGAFTAWKQGKPVQNWAAFYEWAAQCKLIPSCDFAVVPDVIDGDEAANDDLLAEWPLPKWFGAPVWHMHESLERLERLAASWPRVCIGSSGEFLIFPTLAFGALMPLIVVMQFTAKVAGGAVWAFVLDRFKPVAA